MNEKIFTTLFFVFIALIIITIASFFVVISPIRGDNAQKQCELLGYETYTDYSNEVFSTTPVKLVCGTMTQRMIYEGRIRAYSTTGTDVVIQGVNS